MALSQLAANELRKLGYLFYVAPAEDVLIESLEQKKHLSLEVVPTFALLVALEHIFNWWHNKAHRFSTNDALTSISQGMLMEISGVLNAGLSIVAYIWVYENYRLGELPWNSWITWAIAFLAVDFGYYWIHRAAHEINIFWAGHQVHHSSEFYNLTTALRQSVIQEQFIFIIYLPLALFIPPQVYAVHKELNLLYQFWIHSEAVTKIGPLEYILNTPSHHRVHHGVNRYCIDKNFAGVLIIWDRMFGTFTPEADAVVYGLTHPIQTFDPYKIQFGYLEYLIQRFRDEKHWADKLGVLFKGPGWMPGKPRLGLIEDIPDVHAPVPVWNPAVSSWIAPYAFIHYVVLTADYMTLLAQKDVPGCYWSLLVQAGYIFLTLVQLGAFLEGRQGARLSEPLRLVAYMTLCHFVPSYGFVARFGTHWGPRVGLAVQCIYATSFAFMLGHLAFGGPLKKAAFNNTKKQYSNAHGDGDLAPEIGKDR